MVKSKLSRRELLRHAAEATIAVGAAVVLDPLGAPRSGGAGAEEAIAKSRRVPWQALAGSLTGHLVRPHDPSYAVDKLLYNERFDARHPSAIAFCASPSDVQRCVEFARRHHLRLAARSGGHSYGGYSSSDGLVVDVTAMSAVDVDPGRQQATIGAGCRMIDLYSALGAQGLLVPGGSCPTVGIAGLTLGGGVSVFSRQFGLTCDQLAALRIVTADGRHLTCDRHHHADLFWASQGGGGGNFGIVTSFTFDVHPIPPIALFTFDWPWSAATDVLGAWMEWVVQTPDELWSNCQLLSSGSAGGSSPMTARVTGVFCGNGGAASLTGLLEPLRSAIGTAPDYDFVGPEQYLPAMLIEAGCEGMSATACHLPSQDPSGTLSRTAFAAKSAYAMSALPSAGLAAVVDSVAALDESVPQVGGGVVFDAYGGAVNRVPADATAFVHRDAIAGVQWSFSWTTSGASGSSLAAQTEGGQWLTETASRLAPYTSGAYQNYIDPTLRDWERAYYGTNLERLKRIKRAIDPDDFFHFAQSIPVGRSIS